MKKRFKWIIAAILLAAFSTWLLWANKALELNVLTVTESELPDAFNGFRIVHISDLHSTEFGRNNQYLINMIRDAQPDIICITGDLSDSRDVNVDMDKVFFHNLPQIKQKAILLAGKRRRRAVPLLLDL